MGVRNIKKQLAGVEDLLLGVGTQVQERNSGSVPITKINLVGIADTVEALATLDITKYTTAIVKDPDRGGTFVWSPTGTANGGTVFAGATGYWNRQYSGAVNVKWFGAKGDGTNSYPYFELAKTVGKTIQVDEFYTFTQELILENGEAIIGGVSREKCGLIFNGSSGLSMKRHTKIQDIRIIGENQTSSNFLLGLGIYGDNARSSISNVIVGGRTSILDGYNAKTEATAIICNNMFLCAIDDLYVVSCKIGWYGNNDVHTKYGTTNLSPFNGVFHACAINNMEIHSCTAGMYISSPKGIVLNGLTIESILETPLVIDNPFNIILNSPYMESVLSSVPSLLTTSEGMIVLKASSSSSSININSPYFVNGDIGRNSFGINVVGDCRNVNISNPLYSTPRVGDYAVNISNVSSTGFLIGGSYGVSTRLLNVSSGFKYLGAYGEKEFVSLAEYATTVLNVVSTGSNISTDFSYDLMTFDNSTSNIYVNLPHSSTVGIGTTITAVKVSANTSKAIEIKAHPSSGDTLVGDSNYLTSAAINTKASYTKTANNVWTMSK